MKINRASDVFLKAKLEKKVEELTQLKNAFARLHNHHNNLIEEFNQFKTYVENRFELIHSNQSEILDELTQVQKPEVDFINGKRYSGIIEEIVSKDLVQWRGKKYFNIIAKLKNKKDLYKLFVDSNYPLEINDRIYFFFDANDNSLRSLRIIKN